MEAQAMQDTKTEVRPEDDVMNEIKNLPDLARFQETRNVKRHTDMMTSMMNAGLMLNTSNTNSMKMVGLLTVIADGFNLMRQTLDDANMSPLAPTGMEVPKGAKIDDNGKLVVESGKELELFLIGLIRDDGWNNSDFWNKTKAVAFPTLAAVFASPRVVVRRSFNIVVRIYGVVKEELCGVVADITGVYRGAQMQLFLRNDPAILNRVHSVLRLLSDNEQAKLFRCFHPNALALLMRHVHDMSIEQAQHEAKVTPINQNVNVSVPPGSDVHVGPHATVPVAA